MQLAPAGQWRNYDSLNERTVAYPVQLAIRYRGQITAEIGAQCQLSPEVRRHSRGILWADGNPCMTGCLEFSFTRPVLAQSWSQTATDGVWYSTTELPSGRDQSRSLCVLRPIGSWPKARWTGE